MTDAEMILKMIETVDPADTAKLDEIDARVSAYCRHHDKKIPEWVERWPLEFQARIGVGGNKWRVFVPKENGEMVIWWKPIKYTRSRDALKAIRPDGWIFDINWMSGNAYCSVSKGKFSYDDFVSFLAEDLLTEELAELHAVIQAIAHERRTS
ncbi:hypothetical protein [Dyadobacter sp. CY356]|uniref:hypothetical protein n=1 Tax=Dyadobacter sp. CY356 TaxID=2906442 RepID=UPI001F2A80BB|nr:hypothetical protein [Dyadobacter sp. CY356]MCF0055497.1 hypothetical protein [Dyadobacter sp. CY356]